MDLAEPLFLEALLLLTEHFGDDHPESINTLFNLAMLYDKQAKNSLAEEAYIKSITLSKLKLGDSHPKTLSRIYNLSMFYFDHKRYIDAEHLVDETMKNTQFFLQQVLWATSEKTRASYLKQQSYFKNFFFTLFNQNPTYVNAKRALALSLERKGLQLQIATKINAISQSELDPELSQLALSLKNKQQQLLTLSPETAQSQQGTDLKKEIRRQQAELGRAVQQLEHSQQSVTPEQLTSSLSNNSAFIDFIIYTPYTSGKKSATKSKQLMAVIADDDSNNAFKLVSLGDVDSIETLVKSLLTKMEYAIENNHNSESIELYKRLWVPLEPYIKDKKQIYIAPDGILNILPFTVLRKSSATPLLLEDIQINMLSSGRDLVIQPLEGKVTPPAIFAAGLYSPSHHAFYKKQRIIEKSITVAKRASGLKFSPLPNAWDEGVALKKLFHDNGYEEVQFFPLEKATESAVKSLKSPKILHFATHGFYQEDISNQSKTAYQNPLLRSGLALTNANLVSTGKSESGILTAQEILSLSLAGTELVVLSACETGLGEIQINEGVYGLKRSFQNAGAKAVLSSLWNINSVSSKKFMTTFYGYLLGGSPPQKALRSTQLDFLHNTDCDKYGNCIKHPMHWAAFTIVGKH